MWGFGWEVRRKRGLRIMVLSALERSAKNGAEIIDEIEAVTRGWWRPSPGSMYPLLESMTQEGLVKKNDAGKYELSQRAREEMGWSHHGSMHQGRPQTIEDMLGEISGYASYFEDLSKSDKARLGQHRAQIRSLAKRLSDLAADETQASSTSSG